MNYFFNKLKPLKKLTIPILLIGLLFSAGLLLTTSYIKSALAISTDNIVIHAFPLFNTDIKLTSPNYPEYNFSVPANNEQTIGAKEIADGPYSVEIKFAIFSLKYDITIDTTPPNLDMRYPSSTNKDVENIEIATNEDVIIEFTNELNTLKNTIKANEKFVQEIKVNDGINEIKVSAFDNNHNYTSSVISITKDSIPPTIEPLTKSGDVYGSLIDISFKASDDNQLAKILINETPIEHNADGITQTAIKITNGTNIVKVAAADAAGNITEQEFSFDFAIKRPNSVPILMFHHISKNQVENNSLSEDLLEDLLKWLIDNDYSTITFHDLNANLLQDKSIPKKSVILSFDDGYTNNYFNAFRLLKQYNLKGSFGIIPNLVGTDAHNTRWYMNWEEIKEMANTGMEITSHSFSHPYLNTISDANLEYELVASKNEIEKQTGQKVETLIYPSGAYNNKVIEYAKKYGYLSARINGPGPAASINNIYTLPILRVSWGNSADLIGGKINQISR